MTSSRHRKARHSAQFGRSIWWLAGAVAVLGTAWVLSTAFDAPQKLQAQGRAGEGGHTTTPRVSRDEAVRAPFSAAGLQARQAQRLQWQQRLERAQGSLEAYRLSTRYPHDSQPLSAHSDQAYPHEVITEEHLLTKADGKGVEGIRLRTTQERVFVQGNESVRFTVSLRNAKGDVLPFRVLYASARELPPPNSGSTYPEVPLVFNDDGSNGDVVPGDGTFSVQLQPEVQGFAGLFGQIRINAMLQYRGQQGLTYFDILYTPEAPATWQGSVREAMEDGSLNFYLKATVREAGRYVVTARVDDAVGRPFALIRFNEEVEQGQQEFRLSLFGKLVRDGKPAFPVTLRDVNAFLLHENSFPDRSLMPRLQGSVHVSQAYPLVTFADAEWSGEERTRHLSELGRDVAEIQTQVDKLASGP